MLLGFTGNKGVGKDTAAQFLIEHYGFVRLGFADTLKVAASALMGVSLESVEDWKNDASHKVAIMHENRVVTFMTWREFLQRMGTEMGRNVFGEDFWIDRWRDMYTEIKPLHTVVPDVRFNNEALHLRNIGGHIIEVVRPDTEVDGHASEAGISQELITTRVINNGTIAQFEVEVGDMLKGVRV